MTINITNKERSKEYRNRPEIKEHIKKHNKEYRQRPEVKKHMKEYIKNYHKVNKEHIKKYHEDNKEHLREYSREYHRTNKEKIKVYQVKRMYGISLKEYKKIIEKCYLCGFTRTVDCHHLNGKKDNSKLIGLCPNHHKLLHIHKLNQTEINKINNMR